MAKLLRSDSDADDENASEELGFEFESLFSQFLRVFAGWGFLMSLHYMYRIRYVRHVYLFACDGLRYA